MTFKYFAYGSNMFLAKLRKSAQSAKYFTNGKVSGYKFFINKYSHNDKSGKANIVFTNNIDDKVFGVIFDIDQSEKEKLDIDEGGYAPVSLEIETSDRETLTAFLYIAKKNVEELNPYDWYKEFIIRGAKLYRLPEKYVKNTLEMVCQAIPDVKEERSREKWMFIEENKDVY
jgi:cation transport regulator ChaC